MGYDVRRNLAENLKLPKDLLTGDVNVRIMGKREVFIENYRYIIEYSEAVKIAM